MRIFKDSSNANGELLAAGTAFIQSLAGFAACLWGKLVNRLFRMVLAVRANDAVRPEQGFKKLARLVLVGVFLRQRYQVKLVFVRVLFHVNKCVTLIKPVKCFCVTIIMIS